VLLLSPLVHVVHNVGGGHLAHAWCVHSSALHNVGGLRNRQLIAPSLLSGGVGREQRLYRGDSGQFLPLHHARGGEGVGQRSRGTIIAGTDTLSGCSSLPLASTHISTLALILQSCLSRPRDIFARVASIVGTDIKAHLSYDRTFSNSTIARLIPLHATTKLRHPLSQPCSTFEHFLQHP
jgi:hypothetical protein